MKKILSLLTLVLLLAGCGPNTPDKAPRSDVTVSDAEALGQLSGLGDPSRRWGHIAATGSMIPTLDESSVVLYEIVPYDDLHVGDIVVYSNRDGIHVIHRLAEKRGDDFWPLGDHNGKMDGEYVTRQNFLYRVWGILYTDGKS